LFNDFKGFAVIPQDKTVFMFLRSVKSSVNQGYS